MQEKYTDKMTLVADMVQAANDIENYLRQEQSRDQQKKHRWNDLEMTM